MQDSLFPEPEDAPTSPARASRTPAAKVQPARASAELLALARKVPPNLRLGTSSWSYPGWVGSVWDREYPDTTLARYGLRAYAQHPLLRAVSLDRVFYRALSVAQYAAYAAQVPPDFRFVVKAPALVCDAQTRDEAGRAFQANPGFLDPELALRTFAQPAVEGLGARLGALVFQISPLPAYLLDQVPELIRLLHAMLGALAELKHNNPEAVVAVEVRDPQWLVPAFTKVLRAHRATYCLGLHAKMPRIADQLPILRALWPGPLVCRWNLNPLHGAYGYEDARRQYAPYNRLVDPDLQTRQALARVISGTTAAGQNAYVTLSNKAEGSAPLSAVALAEAVVEASGSRT